jgi:hypothetical protein
MLFYIVRLSLKHPSLFGGNEKLDVSWDKGLNDSEIVVAFRRAQFGLFPQQSFVFKVISISTHKLTKWNLLGKRKLVLRN